MKRFLALLLTFLFAASALAEFTPERTSAEITPFYALETVDAVLGEWGVAGGNVRIGDILQGASYIYDFDEATMDAAVFNAIYARWLEFLIREQRRGVIWEEDWDWYGDLDAPTDADGNSYQLNSCGALRIMTIVNEAKMQLTLIVGEAPGVTTTAAPTPTPTPVPTPVPTATPAPAMPEDYAVITVDGEQIVFWATSVSIFGGHVHAGFMSYKKGSKDKALNISFPVSGGAFSSGQNTEFIEFKYRNYSVAQLTERVDPKGASYHLKVIETADGYSGTFTGTIKTSAGSKHMDITDCRFSFRLLESFPEPTPKPKNQATPMPTQLADGSCPYCGGTKKVACDQCKGTKEVWCHSCTGGSNYEWIGGERVKVPCGKCGGDQKYDCPNFECDLLGKVPCLYCR